MPEKTKRDWNSLRKRLISAKMRDASQFKTVKLCGEVYTIVKKIGDGGFGCVYQVYSEKRNVFALKVVNLLKDDGHTDKDLKKEIDYLKVVFDLFTLKIENVTETKR